MTPFDRLEALRRAQDARDPAPGEELQDDGPDLDDLAPWDRRERTRAEPLRVPLRTAARLSPA